MIESLSARGMMVRSLLTVLATASVFCWLPSSLAAAEARFRIGGVSVSCRNQTPGTVVSRNQSRQWRSLRALARAGQLKPRGLSPSRAILLATQRCRSRRALPTPTPPSQPTIPSPTPTVQPTATPTQTATQTPLPGTYATSLSQYGVTWQFDRSYRYGRFANGDFWVVVPPGESSVTITRITPDGVPSRNGWQPNPTTLQAFDDRLTASFLPNLQPALPYNAPANTSILKAVSKTDNTTCSYNQWETCILRTAAVLTVLGEVPADEGASVFRPAFFGATKRLISTTAIRTDLLPTLSPAPTNAPSLSLLTSRFSRPQLDVYGWQWRALHPEEHGPNYGADIARDNGDAVLRLTLSDPLSAKMPLLIAYLQYGIDLYGMMQNGMRYPASGGHGAGRKLPLAFTALLLDDTQMKDFVSTAPASFFSESGDTTPGVAAGEPLFGQESNEGNYWDVLIDYDAPGSRTVKDPYGFIDGGHIPGTSYQSINLGPGKGTALAVRLIPGLATVFNDNNFLRYLDRWSTVGAWTQPDPCAPMTGTCSAGPNAGQSCTSASPASACPSGVCSYVGRKSLDYGVLYGPDGAGDCIRDTNSSDGTGRFPLLHGSNRDTAAYGSGFASSMWTAFR